MCELLSTNPVTIGEAIRQTRLLLDEQRVAIAPTTLCFTEAQQVLDYIAGRHAPTRKPLPDELSHPALTGMTRQDLDTLIDRLTIPHAATIERRRHRQRGGDRLPGTRRGVFPQKITDTNRVLATILYQRRFCTRQVLADLFNVSRGTISNAIAEVAPLLEQHGPIIEPAGRKFATATDILNSVTPSTDPQNPRRTTVLILYGSSASGTAAGPRRAGSPRSPRPGRRGRRR
ncbi:transposase family protein [Actinomadura sp. 7K507]|nr:transposase family protein [Actinomadura sp. 7K507]